MVARFIFNYCLVLTVFSANAVLASEKTDKQKLVPMMECAGTYAAASYVVRNFKKLKVEEGEDRQQVADDFQRLSNILKYFASNSGYEAELSVETQKHIDEALAKIKENKEFDTLTEAIESCDQYVDQLHEIYNE